MCSKMPIKNFNQSDDLIIHPSIIYPPPHPALLMDGGVFVEAVKLNFVSTFEEETLPELDLPLSTHPLLLCSFLLSSFFSPDRSLIILSSFISFVYCLLFLHFFTPLSFFSSHFPLPPFAHSLFFSHFVCLFTFLVFALLFPFLFSASSFFPPTALVHLFSFPLILSSFLLPLLFLFLPSFVLIHPLCFFCFILFSSSLSPSLF